MTVFDWLDRHWFVGGWCCVIVCAGFASILHGIGRLVGGKQRAE